MEPTRPLLAIVVALELLLSSGSARAALPRMPAPSGLRTGADSVEVRARLRALGATITEAAKSGKRGGAVIIERTILARLERPRRHLQLRLIGERLTRLRLEGAGVVAATRSALGDAPPDREARGASLWLSGERLQAVRCDRSRCELIDVGVLVGIVGPQAEATQAFARQTSEVTPVPPRRLDELSPIYWAAILVSAVALGVGGALIARRKLRGRRLPLGLAILLELPGSAVAYFGLRLPLQRIQRRLLGSSRGALLGFLRTFDAPLTEEPAKLLPALLPWLSRLPRADALEGARLGLALGLGFGVGEAWFLAERLAASDQFGGMPWYYFTGFINERLAACLLHGVLTATALRQVPRGARPTTLGVLAAMGLHYVANLPIYFSGIDLAGLGPGTWQAIVHVWFVVMLFVVLLLLARYLAPGRSLREALRHHAGRALCPECGIVYHRPLLLAINTWPRRYERCPGCRRWHWTSALDDAPKGSSPPTKDTNPGAGR